GRKLRRRGIRVEVASVEQSLGNDLKMSANSIVDLIELFDRFEQQKHNKKYHRIGTLKLFD
ncbi:MAG: NYN domain-containing protein, partial [Oscillatoriales cyanobacterium RM2_1_1]|nr:NYN domain-containing protein [Oscillatoriales cyanobacterium RM2_1_1]